MTTVTPNSWVDGLDWRIAKRFACVDDAAGRTQMTHRRVGLYRLTFSDLAARLALPAGTTIEAADVRFEREGLIWLRLVGPTAPLIGEGEMIPWVELGEL